jgi:AmiR/NasT family two-component response regulator
MSNELNAPQGDSRQMPDGASEAMRRMAPDRSNRQGFGDLDVAVMTERDDAGEQLIRELQRTRARVTHIWPAPAQVPVTFDVVYCDLLDDLPQRLPWPPGEPMAALVVILSSTRSYDMGVLHNCAPQAVVHLPVTAQSVLASLFLGHDHFLYERRLRGRIEKLDDNLRTMRSVERAKAILMQTRSVSGGSRSAL